MSEICFLFPKSPTHLNTQKIAIRKLKYNIGWVGSCLNVCFSVYINIDNFNIGIHVLKTIQKFYSIAKKILNEIKFKNCFNHFLGKSTEHKIKISIRYLSIIKNTITFVFVY